MLASTAYVYNTIMSSKLNISQVLNQNVLYNPKYTPTTNRRYGYYRGSTTTTSELDDYDAHGLTLMRYAWYYNDTDVLVEGYMWWLVAFQLFGVIYSVAARRKLAAFGMHVVLTACTFTYTRTVLSGYLFCLLETVGEHRKKFKSNVYSDTFDQVKTGLAVLLAGCIIVGVGNVLIVHSLAFEVETSLTEKKDQQTTTLPQVIQMSPAAAV